jgi:hypothetical protein
MKKYYVIKMAYDSGFWSEQHQDFKGWLYATKYSLLSAAEHHVISAAQKKPIVILEVYENE